MPEPSAEVRARALPATGWLLGLALGLCLLVLPAVLPYQNAVVASCLGGLLLVGLGEAWWSRLAIGPVQLEGSVLVARTARGTSTVDLSRLRYVGGHQLRSQGGAKDTLFLRDASRRRVALTGDPGFPPRARWTSGAAPQVYEVVRAAVVAGQVHDVSEAAKRVLGLPSRKDSSETVYALALWAVGLAAAAVALVGPILLWPAVVDLR